MPRKPKPPADDPEQSKRFIETAREIGADETREGADRAFKRVVPPKKASATPRRTIPSSKTLPLRIRVRRTAVLP